MEDCLSPELMDRLLDDRLTPSETSWADAHLRVCDKCRKDMDNRTAGTPAVLAALCPAVPPPVSLSSAPPGFELLERLRDGKTAVVYRARQERPARIVALKVLSGGWPSEEEARRRFEREIEAAASQNHPGVVQLYEVGSHEGHPFLVMEYCPGGNLAERLRGGPMPPRRAAELIETLARTLHAIHNKDLVHRDLKPANILFDDRGEPKIADFGVVKRLGSVDLPTLAGSILGTPPYMAPEQIKDSSAARPRCDLYALGAILYECLVGRPPFPADSLFDVLHQEPLPPRRYDPRLPRDLETICLKCLEKEPKHRYDSALSLADDLRRYLDRRPILARRAGVLGRLWRWGRRNPLPAALTAALALTVLFGLALCGWFWYQAVANGREAEAARRDAEKNYLRTRRLLPELVSASTGSPRLDAERFRLRRNTLEGACALYRELCRARPDDGELHGELAQVLTSLAELSLFDGYYPTARETAEEAVTLWRQLRDEAPGDPRWRAGMARALLHLAAARDRLGHFREMAEAYQEAIALCEGLANQSRGEDRFLWDCVRARQALSDSRYGEMKIDESLFLLEKNRKQLEEYRASGFDSAAIRLVLAETLYRLGQHFQLRGDGAKAICYWRDGYQRAIGLDVALPQEPNAWYFSTACARRLPSNDPAVLTPAQAIPRLERAIQLLEVGYAVDPQSTWEKLAEVARCLADNYLEAGRPADALRMERRGAEALPLRAEGFTLMELVRLVGAASVARRERQTGQTEAARRHAQEVANGYESVCRTHARDAVFLGAAVDFCPRIAPALRHAGATDQSRRVVASALEIERREGNSRGDAAHWRRLAEIWLQMAKCRMRDERNGVEAALREAVDAARRLVAESPEHRYVLDDRLARLAHCLAAKGHRRQAAAHLHECERLWQGDADGLRGVARGFRELANEVKLSRIILSSQERNEQDEYLAEARRLERAADTLRTEK
ncbi:MAG TPA: serine/threonine-protein kinase [Gemmataceae bacterium]|nr:serine/threonine-protein kinase [Gemmataceae bacterium]